jgi:hypothetical protein
MKINATITAALLIGLCCITRTILGDPGVPPTYPMVCRGGAGMRIMVNHDVDAAGIPGATAMFIYFKPASRPGSVSQPPPGECTWMDRTLGSGEPAVLWLRSPHVEFAFQVYGDGRVARDASGIRLSPEGASPEAQKWRYLTDGVLDGRLFTARVYNDSGRVMVVTSVGP